MMKLLIIPLLLLSLLSKAQPAVVQAKLIDPTQQLYIPQDTTTVAPRALGELRRMGAIIYSCRALSGNWKWAPTYRVLTVMSIGGGSPTLSPLSTIDTLKLKTPTSLDNSAQWSYTDSTYNISITPTFVTITSGSSSTLSRAKNLIVRFSPPSVISSYTLTFPSSPQTGDQIRILNGSSGVTTGTVVTTFTASASATIIGSAVTTLVVGTAPIWVYDGTYWIRQQ